MTKATDVTCSNKKQTDLNKNVSIKGVNRQAEQMMESLNKRFCKIDVGASVATVRIGAPPIGPFYA